MARKATSLKDALAQFEQAKGVKAEDAEKIELLGVCPPIEKLDGSLAHLSRCRHLSLSTNAIDRIGPLAGLDQLEVLSLGRNCLKKLENLDAVAGTLQELWVSYNQLDRLAGIERCRSLRVLYASNNRIRDASELDRLSGLPALEDLLLVGNPLYNEARDSGALPAYRLEVLRRAPGLRKLDGVPVEVDERAAAAAAAAARAAPAGGEGGAAVATAASA